MNILTLTHCYPLYDGDHSGRFIKEFCEIMGYQDFKFIVSHPDSYSQTLLGRIKLTWELGVNSLRCARDNEFKLVHAHWWFPAGLIGVFISILYDKPLLITCHGSDVKLLDRWIFKQLFKLVKFRASKIVIVSNYLKQKVEVC